LRPDGAGELVLSSVANPAMPLLRYRSGDFVDLVSEPCACGLQGRRIRSLTGRLIQNFRLIDGSEYSPTHLDCLFKHFPIREFQATQLSGNLLRIEIEPSSQCGDRSQLLERVRRYVKEELQLPMAVEMGEAEFESHGKFQRYRVIPSGDLNPSSIGA
jgi:phenylacetate-CoA ligase